MKLNDTDGTLAFDVVDQANGTRTRIDPSTTLETWQAGRMDGRPDMIHQYARHLAREARQQQDGKVEVYVEARVSLNNRPPQLLIDPEVDLAQAPVVGCLRHAPWIVPLVVGGR